MSRIALLFALLLTAQSAVASCRYCVLDRIGSRWQVSEIAETNEGVRVRVGLTADPHTVADLTIDERGSRFVVPADQGEARARQRDRGNAERAPCRAIPYRNPSRDVAVKLRPHLRLGHSVEEEVGPCVRRNDLLWFGLTFYEGEGADGVGGLGAYSPATGTIEVRRPEWLRDKSIDHLAHDGRFLWFSAAQQWERGGPSHGLVRYDWETKELRPMRGSDAPCGFDVSALRLIDRELWVATDLGISRRSLTAPEWRHFVVAADGGTLREVSCEKRLTGLLDSAASLTLDQSCPNLCEEETLAESVARFHPEIARRYFLRKEHLIEAELAAFAQVARNFSELRTKLERHQHIGEKGSEHDLSYALEAFAATKSRDSEWRDFILEGGRDIDLLKHFRGDEKVAAALNEIIEREIGKPRPDLGSNWELRGAVEMLPWILGSRAMPKLREIIRSEAAGVRSAKRDGLVLATAIQAIERAAHLRIEADGTEQPLASDSDTPDYAAEEFGAFQRSPRATDELLAIAEGWLARERGEGA